MLYRTTFQRFKFIAVLIFMLCMCNHTGHAAQTPLVPLPEAPAGIETPLIELLIETVPAVSPWQKDFEEYHPDHDVDMQLWCLARVIFYEGRSSKEADQIVIGQVALNRVNKPGFPDTICEVVYQPSRNPKRPKACQYSFTCNPQAAQLEDEMKAWDTAYRLAASLYYELYSGPQTTADHYHRDDVSPSWAMEMAYLGKSGRHLLFEG